MISHDITFLDFHIHLRTPWPNPKKKIKKNLKKLKGGHATFLMNIVGT